jgi:hypothetical protein
VVVVVVKGQERACHRRRVTIVIFIVAVALMLVLARWVRTRERQRCHHGIDIVPT